MAELVTVVPAVISIIQIADRIVGLCKHYIETVRDAPSDLRVIFVEISTLKTILEDLKFLSSCSIRVAGPGKGLSRLDQPIAECLRLVKELETLFPAEGLQTPSHLSKRRKLKATLTELAWPLKESRARKLLEGIRPLKETITLELTSQSRQDIREIKSQVSKTNDILTETQRQDVFRWLQHTDPSSLYHKAQQDYEPGTGNWVFQTTQWSDWIDLKARCLWIHGIPGAGKTVLMHPLIEEIQLRCKTPEIRRCVCLYYFCFYGHNQDEAKPFLRWLINQLCRRNDSIPNSVLSLYNYGGEPSLGDLLEALKDVLLHVKTAYVVIDALDESKPREELLHVIRQLVTDTQFQNLQLLASSREYIDIQKAMGEISTSLSMDNEFVGRDIRTYVRSFIHSSGRFTRFPSDLLDEIEDAVSKGARGMFRWAVCQLDVLRRLKCERDIIRKALKNLPKTLHETYDKIILNFSEDERYTVYCLFQWIQFHFELHTHGIPCRILAKVAEKSTIERDGFQLEYFYDEDTLKELCGCLIKVSSETVNSSADYSSDDDTLTDHDTLTVNFAHYTIREYLDASIVIKDLAANLATGEKSRMREPLKVVFEEAHQIQFNTTGMRKISSPDPTDVLDAIYDDFNISCTLSALLALKNYGREISQQESLYILAVSLLDPSDPCFRALCTVADQIERSVKWFSSRDIDPDQQFWKVIWKEAANAITMQLLHLLCFTKCSVSALPLIEKLLGRNSMGLLTQDRLRFQKEIYMDGEDVIWQDFVFDGSCIEATAQCVDADTRGFGLLLETSKGLFDPSEILRLYIGRHFHIECFKHCVVEQLLRYGANPNVRSHRVTPLQIAVAHRDFDVVRMLLEAEADPNEAGGNTERPWEDQSLMSRYNDLYNASPLYICMHLEGVGYPWTENIVLDEEIGAILVEYGAKSFMRQERQIEINPRGTGTTPARGG